MPEETPPQPQPSTPTKFLAALSPQQPQPQPQSSDSSSGFPRISMQGQLGSMRGKLKKLGQLSSTHLDKAELENAKVVADQIDVPAIDKIFINSGLLNSHAIEDFVKCLCQVSSSA